MQTIVVNKKTYQIAETRLINQGNVTAALILISPRGLYKQAFVYTDGTIYIFAK